jgi:cation/acetate symporter
MTVALLAEATGKSTSLLQDVDFSWFPLNNPGLVSIPLSFFLGWLGTKLSKEQPDELKTAELEVRSLTGIGAKRPSSIDGVTSEGRRRRG